MTHGKPLLDSGDEKSISEMHFHPRTVEPYLAYEEVQENLPDSMVELGE